MQTESQIQICKCLISIRNKIFINNSDNKTMRDNTQYLGQYITTTWSNI